MAYLALNKIYLPDADYNGRYIGKGKIRIHLNDQFDFYEFRVDPSFKGDLSRDYYKVSIRGFNAVITND